jgi:GNAT superfamily N-acetyltransferase
MTRIAVRPAEAGDVAGISAVGSASFHAAYDGTAAAGSIARHVDAHFGTTAVSRELADPRVAYLVAVRDAGCLGFAKLRDATVPQPVPGASPIELQQLYVDPRRQRRGFGRRLVDAAADRARDGGRDGLWLSVWTEADWATSFYRRCGFVTLGNVPFLLDDTEYIDYLMWLPLTGC